MADIENFIGAFENIGRFLFTLVEDVNAMYFAVFILLTFLIFAILVAAIGLIPGFGQDKKANRFGKIIAFSIALLSSISLYTLGKQNDMVSVINNILPIYGVFAGAVMAILFFCIVYFGFGQKEHGKWQLALLGIGFGMAVSGYFITQPSIQALGWLIGIIGLILYISSAGIIEETKNDTK